jgi:hypothetical protein
MDNLNLTWPDATKQAVKEMNKEINGVILK